jgi:WD40 repeat protein
VAFSPDSLRLMSASWDRTVKVWDLNPADWGFSAPRLMLAVAGLPAGLTGVALNCDGRRFAVSSLDGTVTICDAHSGQKLGTLRTDAGPVYGVAFHPAGNTLASAHYDGTVKVWDIEPAQAADVKPLLLSFLAHTDGVREVAYSPDGRFLATAGGRDQDKNLGIWEAAKGKLIHSIYQNQFVRSVAFSPDSQRLAAASAPQPMLWDVTTGQMLRTISPVERAFRVVFSPDGRRLATACEGQAVWLWDVATGQKVVRLHVSGGELWNVAFSPDGRYLATCSGYKGKGTIQIWDASAWAVRSSP